MLETTLTFNPTHFDVATGDVRLLGTIVDVDAGNRPGDGDPANFASTQAEAERLAGTMTSAARRGGDVKRAPTGAG